MLSSSPELAIGPVRRTALTGSMATLATTANPKYRSKDAQTVRG